MKDEKPQFDDVMTSLGFRQVIGAKGVSCRIEQQERVIAAPVFEHGKPPKVIIRSRKK